MRFATQTNRNRTQTARYYSIPAPVGGWDTESPLADMPPENAIILENWIPRAGYVELRRGFVQQVTGTDAVPSMIVHRSGTGDQIFAASGTDIYDVTNEGALGSAVYGSASSDRWRYTNFSNDAGAFSICVNSTTRPLAYNGSAFNGLTITSSSSSFTGAFTDVMLHKRRLHFIQKDSLKVWFLDTNAIQGPAYQLDLGLIFYKGGKLVSLATWTIDGGQGVDDFAVYMTDQGQVAMYQGTDPADPNNWSLVGVYDLAPPLAARALIKYGSDLVVLTKDGVVPMSQALNLDRAQDDKVALTAKIRTAFSNAANAYGNLYGWQGLFYPGTGSLAIFNVPTAELQTSVQFVQSIQTGAWCKFTGINALCWELANGNIYFGSIDGVYRWDIGASDDGETIVGDIKSAFQSFGNRAAQKHFTQIRPLMKCPAIVQPALEVLTDYRESTPVAVPTVVTPGDISVTDADAIRYDWTGASSIGYVGAPRLRLSLVGSSTSSRIATNGALTDLLVTAPGGDYIIDRPNLPLEVDVQLIGYDLGFIPGGQL